MQFVNTRRNEALCLPACLTGVFNMDKCHKDYSNLEGSFMETTYTYI